MYGHLDQTSKVTLPVESRLKIQKLAKNIPSEIRDQFKKEMKSSKQNIN